MTAIKHTCDMTETELSQMTYLRMLWGSLAEEEHCRECCEVAVLLHS